MIAKEQLKSEIERLDDQYLELAFKIICQFPRAEVKPNNRKQGSEIISILQEIADSGGLGIKDPLLWQRKMRRDRFLPFGNEYGLKAWKLLTLLKFTVR